MRLGKPIRRCGGDAADTQRNTLAVPLADRRILRSNVQLGSTIAGASDHKANTQGDHIEAAATPLPVRVRPASCGLRGYRQQDNWTATTAVIGFSDFSCPCHHGLTRTAGFGRLAHVPRRVAFGLCRGREGARHTVCLSGSSASGSAGRYGSRCGKGERLSIPHARRSVWLWNHDRKCIRRRRSDIYRVPRCGGTGDAQVFYVVKCLARHLLCNDQQAGSSDFGRDALGDCQEVVPQRGLVPR
jgi:hypothetical protein